MASHIITEHTMDRDRQPQDTYTLDEVTEICRHIFEGFSTLSDAQCLIMDFGRPEEGSEQINHAKRHLDQVRLLVGDRVYANGMGRVSISCDLPKED